MQNRLLFILILLFGALTLRAETISQLKEYSWSDGYVYGQVNDMLQAQNGLFWFSTRSGLANFNGYRFENYKTYPGEQVSMGETNITSIHENSEGDIWCKNQDGRFYLFDVDIRRFIDIFSARGSYPDSLETVDHIYPLSKGVTWVTFEGGKCIRIDNALCKKGLGIEYKDIDCNTIYDIFQVQDGNEWLLTDKGVYVFGEKDFSIAKTFLHAVRQKDNIWLSDGHRLLARYNLPTHKLDYVDLPKNTESVVMFRSIGQDTIALGTLKSGLLLFNSLTSSFKQIDVNVNPGSANEVFSVYEDKIGDLWMSNRFAGIIHYEKATGKVNILQSPQTSLIKNIEPNKFLVYENSAGTLWIIPKEGNLCYYDRKDKQLKYYYSNPDVPESIVSPYISYYFIDKNENIWFDNKKNLGKITTFKTNVDLIEKLNGETKIRSILIDTHENHWVGAKNHVLRIMDANMNLVGYVTEKGQISNTPVSFGSNVYCLYEDKSGNIWIGTRFNGLYLFKPNKDFTAFSVKHFVNDPANKYSLSNNSIYNTYQDSKDRIWIGTYGGGLNLIMPGEKDSLRFLNSNNVFSNYPVELGSSIRYITEFRENTMLLATKNGLISFTSNFDNPEQIHFYFNTRRPENPSSLTNSDVLYVCVDKHENVFVLTRNGGINKIESDDLLTDSIRFSSFTERNGLPSDQTLSMLESDNGDLWVASSQALMRYFPEQNKIETYGNSWPTSLQFSEAVPVEDNKGRLLFGTHAGILRLDAQNASHKIFTPHLIFTEIDIQGAKIDNNEWQANSLVLNANQRNISIEFAALDYRDPGEIQYQYKLVGFEDEWHSAFKERSATYINIPPGDYEFLVKSTNSEGIWTDNAKTLSLTVKPRFVETKGAWILFFFIAVLLILVISFVLFTFYKLKLKVINEQKLTDLKLSFFTELSHELRTPLTLISSPIKDILADASLSDKTKELLFIVNSNTDRLLRIVNQLLDFRKIEKYRAKLFVENTEIASFIKEIMKDFQLIAIEKNIRFTLDVASESLFLWVDKDKFEKIIYNLISNSFKYSTANKTITIRLNSNSTNATISIEDQGVGILPDKIKNLFKPFETAFNKLVAVPSTGIGLSLVKELTELHGGKIEVESTPNVGTKFILQFKLGLDHLKSNKKIEILLSDSNLHTLDTLNINRKKNENDPETDDKRFSILMVEDNEELLRYLSGFLSNEFKVTTAVNGLEGLNKTVEIIPDLILTDIVMPVMDGLDMVAHIKKNKELSHIPIILLSSKNGLDDRIHALENGIDDYISKPFSSNLLMARIRFLRERQKKMQLYFMNTVKGIYVKSSDSLEPTHPEVIPEHQLFLEQLMKVMEEHIDNASLTVDIVAEELCISRNVLFRKTKQILGISPVNVITEIRIKRAIQLFDSGISSISEVAYSCGFNDPNYFAKCFKKVMNCSPTKYRTNT